MAISEVHFDLLCDLRRRNVLPESPRLLEIGQATYYGDMNPKRILQAAEEFGTATEQMRRNPFNHEMTAVQSRVYALSIYVALGLSRGGKLEVASIDPGGDDHADKFDLNEPMQLDRKFSLLINHGTAEHVFNIANVFKVMHDHCEVEGVMIHEAPCTGWFNHGFWNLQPTAFYDIARANNYRIEGFWLMHLPSVKAWRFDSQEHLLRVMRAGELPNNLNLFVAFRKIFDLPFSVPQQGVYTPFASQEVREAWQTMR